MRLFRPGIVAGWLYSEAIFRIRTSEKQICLSFDDGPDPDSTPHLLNILRRHNVKGVFFCKGGEAEKYPYLIDQIRMKGHLIGNHGFNHLNGWTTSLRSYYADISKAAPFTSYTLFRPPFGRLRLKQYIELKKKYTIVFWDIMPYDFDPRIGSKKSLQIIKRKIRPGSIIAFHDNSKSNLHEYIDEFISYALDEGYSFIVSLK